MATPSSSMTSPSPPLPNLPPPQPTNGVVLSDFEREERNKAVNKFMARAEISMVSVSFIFNTFGDDPHAFPRRLGPRQTHTSPVVSAPIVVPCTFRHLLGVCALFRLLTALLFFALLGNARTKGPSLLCVLQGRKQRSSRIPPRTRGAITRTVLAALFDALYRQA